MKSYKKRDELYNMVHATGVVTDTRNGKPLYFQCHSKSEISIALAKASKLGLEINYFFAHSRYGMKLIGAKKMGAGVKPADIPDLIKLISCPKCQGAGCSFCENIGVITIKELSGVSPWESRRLMKERQAK